MAYQVLARKWRPRDFEQMVGQEHVLRALVNALDNQRLHHAYLFTGTRGVGKTTVARAFAKSLNCDTGVTSKPCGSCSACQGIDAGRFVDLIEVDAASRTGVDDTRELLENVQYTPTEGRYKVYLIDEVHMFSNHSFNALLKTLEEPPPHVKFLLATTDPQKLPVTILSRCLQFNLKRLSTDAIAAYLGKVLDRESVEYQAGALGLIARAADGSMRDGLSLLDQAIAFGGGRVGQDEVRAMLGTIAGDQVFGLLEDLADGDAAALMERVAGQAEMGIDYAAWLADLVTLLQRVALVQQLPAALDESFGEPQRIQALAERLSAEDAQLYYQIGLLGRRDLPLSPEPRGGFEMVLLRMLAFRPASAGAPPAGGGKGRAVGPDPATVAPQDGRGPADAQPAPAPEQRRPSGLEQARAMLGGSGGSERPATTETGVGGDRPAADPAGESPAAVDWLTLMPELGLEAVARELASHCVQRSWGPPDPENPGAGARLVLSLDPSKAGLLNEQRRAEIDRALTAHVGYPVRVEIRVEQNAASSPALLQQRAEAERLGRAQRCIADDVLVRAMQERLGATVLADSVRAVDGRPEAR